MMPTKIKLTYIVLRNSMQREEDICAMTIDMLGLIARPYHALSRCGIKTVEELLHMDSHQLMCISKEPLW